MSINPKYQILSLDGGGIRGYLTVRLLEEFTKVPGLERAFDSVYLLAGNSSGALIALGMARARALNAPMSRVLPELAQLFRDGDRVFGKQWPYLGGYYLFSKYRNHARGRVLDEQLAKTKLKELGAKVVITTFDLDNEGVREERPNRSRGNGESDEKQGPIRRWKPKIFHNFTNADGSEPSFTSPLAAPSPATKRPDPTPDREELARNVALYSTAAPAYFPPADGYVDGGVYANNPAMCALAQMFDKQYEPLIKPALTDVAMFSVGAGRTATFVEQKWWKPWGAIPWLLFHHYIEIPTDGTVGVADYQCRQILGEENYHRCDIDFPQRVSFALDDTWRVSEIEAMVVEATRQPAFKTHCEWLQRYWVRRELRVPVPPEFTSRHIQGATELTCLLPIKKRFADVFETHTYTTRLRILLRSLHSLRLASRESVPERMFPDVVDAIRAIHSFRLSIIGDKLMLAVDFDRPWEPYMRIVWRGLGELLDLILINCEGYEGHTFNDGFDCFAAYIRAHQIDAELYYTGSPHTVDDVAYLTQLESVVREKGTGRAADLEAAKLQVETPEETARKAAARNPREVVRQGLRVLAVFYKLREVYRELTPDEAYLRAAVAATLKTFKPKTLPITDEERTQYRRELAWFESITKSDPPTDTRKPTLKEVQAGVVEAGQAVTHGCLLLARIENPAFARKCLADLLAAGAISRHGDPPYPHGDLPYKVFINVAFTPQGLKRLGLPELEFAAFPKEFREGMDARAGMLGDIAANHPDKWTLPEWNWDGPGAQENRDLQVPRVRLSSIDLVLQLRAHAGRGAKDEDADWLGHPLRDTAHKFVATHCNAGIRVLSVQPMLQYTEDRNGRDVAVEHFGFRDGISQPRVDDKFPRDKVKLGEVVLGYENDRGDPPYYDRQDKRALVPGRCIGGLLDNGTFLVIRKLEQHVGVVRRQIAKFIEENEGANYGLTPEDLYAKLMGRDRHGAPATGGPPKSNDFDYKNDDGSRCPLHAHIRLGNPRDKDNQRGPIPRIARRAMSYGPRWQGPDDHERGMMFLAYNASIAEQYEVIQRWMTAGNSTREFSGRNDPFLRVAQTGREDTFLFPHGKDVVRLNLGDKPFVSLKWGMYLFVPSISAIGYLATLGKPDEMAQELQVSRGQMIIETLKTDEEWRVALEDSTSLSSGQTAAVCAAIRELHGGAIRTPGNLVLVANHELGMNVLRDDTIFLVSEYRRRMMRSFGDIYLGHDSTDPEYRRLSTKPNKAIHEITDHEAFLDAQGATESLLQALTANATFPMRLSLETVVDSVLGELATVWFGIPDGDIIRSGDKPEDGGTDQSLHCPFHFLAPSRYIFSSPRPRLIVSGAGEKAGMALRVRIGELARGKAKTGEWPAHLPPIGQAVWDVSTKTNGEIDSDAFASAIIGAMEGMLPTIYGNFWKTMYLWLTDETLWRVQQTLLLTPLENEKQHPEFERARKAVLPTLLRTMQARPIPDMVYRTARKRTFLGDVTVEQGDRVVVLIGSITQELAAQNEERAAKGLLPDVYPVFGGDRDGVDPPTHACPGYHMALGVLLGMITAVLEAGTFAPTPTPLLVDFTGPRPAPKRPRPGPRRVVGV